MANQCLNYVWVEVPAGVIDAVRYLNCQSVLMADPRVIAAPDGGTGPLRLKAQDDGSGRRWRVRYRYTTRDGPIEAPLAALSARSGGIRVTLVYVDEMLAYQGYAEFRGGKWVGGRRDPIQGQQGELPDHYPFAAVLKAEWARESAAARATPATAGPLPASSSGQVVNPAGDAERHVSDRTLVYEVSETLYLIHLEIVDPAYTLDAIVSGLNGGGLWLENATAGNATVRVADAAKPDGRVIAAGLVERDFEGVSTRNYRTEGLLTFERPGDVVGSKRPSPTMRSAAERPRPEPPESASAGEADVPSLNFSR